MKIVSYIKQFYKNISNQFVIDTSNKFVIDPTIYSTLNFLEKKIYKMLAKEGGSTWWEIASNLKLRSEEAIETLENFVSKGYVKKSVAKELEKYNHLSYEDKLTYSLVK